MQKDDRWWWIARGVLPPGAWLVVLQGLPAAGKSTFGRELEDAHRDRVVRVNRDDIRVELAAMDTGEDFDAEADARVAAVRNQRIKDGLDLGYIVLVDETNLRPGVLMHFRKMAVDQKAGFLIRSFDTPVRTCIDRDKARELVVGSQVIHQMNAHWTGHLEQLSGVDAVVAGEDDWEDPGFMPFYYETTEWRGWVTSLAGLKRLLKTHQAVAAASRCDQAEGYHKFGYASACAGDETLGAFLLSQGIDIRKDRPLPLIRTTMRIDPLGLSDRDQGEPGFPGFRFESNRWSGIVMSLAGLRRLQFFFAGDLQALERVHMVNPGRGPIFAPLFSSRSAITSFAPRVDTLGRWLLGRGIDIRSGEGAELLLTMGQMAMGLPFEDATIGQVAFRRREGVHDAPAITLVDVNRKGIRWRRLKEPGPDRRHSYFVDVPPEELAADMSAIAVERGFQIEFVAHEGRVLAAGDQAGIDRLKGDALEALDRMTVPLYAPPSPTGRRSSAEPEMQRIPRPGEPLRKIESAPFSGGDYEALERGLLNRMALEPSDVSFSWRENDSSPEAPAFAAPLTIDGMELVAGPVYSIPLEDLGLPPADPNKSHGVYEVTAIGGPGDPWELLRGGDAPEGIEPEEENDGDIPGTGEEDPC